MKILIVEDEFTSRTLIQTFLSPYGEVHLAVDGQEAVEAFKTALADHSTYDLVCMDIMMPEMDGQEALKQIRELEKQAGIPEPDEVKAIMTSALNDPKNVFEAYHKGGATAYLVKPVKKAELLNLVKEFELI